MGKTPIEWTEHTVNPIRARNRATGKVGHFCEKISPGCAHCYASEWNENRLGTGLPFLPVWRPSVELFLDEAKLQEVLRRKRPTTYFWCDMTDLFYAGHPDEWIDRCFATMALTPQHTHQVLTKRADRMREYLTEEAGARVWGLAGRSSVEMFRSEPWPLPNVWLGVSVEDQQRADERIPHLLQTPAAVRFLSCEPLLSGINLKLHSVLFGNRGGPGNINGENVTFPGIDWVIIGGESGPGARPCNVAWVRSLVAHCATAGVPCFVKQLGSLAVSEVACQEARAFGLRDRKGGDPAEWSPDLRVREFPEVPR